MASHFDPSAFKACYAQFRQADEDRQTFVNQLLAGYEALHRENAKIREQLENEKETRMIWQEQARSFKNELTQTRLTAEAHPFVIMIIDGDGAKFRDELFRNGENGGGYAAQELKKQIRSHLQTHYPDLSIENWSIIVQFYANLDGLAKTLASRHILANSSDLQKFASGFGRANSLFSFVDVGYGKDKADHKCREMLKVMLHAPSCRHVFFGPCRDNGYLTLLEEYKHDPARNKLSLFSAEPPEPGFLDLGFEIINFPTVFRSEPLNNTPSTYKHTQTGAYDIGIQPFPPACSDAQADDISAFGDTSPFVPPSVLSTRSSTATTSASAPPPPATWAAVSKLSTGPVIDLYKQGPAAPKQRFALFNASNQRVDERLLAADMSAFRSLDNKANAQGRNFCNLFHLTNNCDKGDRCGYQHDVFPKLTTAEKLALRHKNRQNACVDGRWCVSPYCLHGHHCKYFHNGQLCPWGSKCFFKDTHDADTKATIKVYEDGTREVIA
ncbi:hypothetical protein N0V93_009899 [Gnomoniopsis smithogilvyi]|uniref:C3H1-type domain-containing protein n=1 Tax=Gnomoniopsis smithogilvyi TaxID=1191159 RepID=A0A9W8YK49_9PEZI|nr:hypothetical protein N0V93_009899 [Gnomoniopsis smithogilvyi]